MGLSPLILLGTRTIYFSLCVKYVGFCNNLDMKNVCLLQCRELRQLSHELFSGWGKHSLTKRVGHIQGLIIPVKIQNGVGVFSQNSLLHKYLLLHHHSVWVNVKQKGQGNDEWKLISLVPEYISDYLNSIARSYLCKITFPLQHYKEILFTICAWFVLSETRNCCHFGETRTSVWKIERHFKFLIES